MIQYINLQLAAIGQPVYNDESDLQSNLPKILPGRQPAYSPGVGVLVSSPFFKIV